MVGESWNVFTKRSLVAEKYISDGIMCENPGGHAPTSLDPAADAHGGTLEEQD